MKNFKLDKSIDWVITILPLVIIGIISSLLMLFPQASGEVINTLRTLFVNEWLKSGTTIVLDKLFEGFSSNGLDIRYNANVGMGLHIIIRLN